VGDRYATGGSTKIDTDEYPDPIRQFTASWSSDSSGSLIRKTCPALARRVRVFMARQEVLSGLDGLADSISPTFDARQVSLFHGKHQLWPKHELVEMSSLDRPVRRSIYLVVLSANEPSPLLPETGDEPKQRTFNSATKT
jgi:tricorn protease